MVDSATQQLQATPKPRPKGHSGWHPASRKTLAYNFRRLCVATMWREQEPLTERTTVAFWRRCLSVLAMKIRSRTRHDAGCRLD
jgi:hypothetical protein